MPLIEADLSDVGPIEAGTYECTVLSATPGRNKSGKNPGAPNLALEIEVDVNGTKRKRTVTLQTTGPGASRYANALRAFGFANIADALQRKERVSFDSDSFTGQRAKCQIAGRIREDEGHKGEESDEVKTFIAL